MDKGQEGKMELVQIGGARQDDQDIKISMKVLLEQRVRENLSGMIRKKEVMKKVVLAGRRGFISLLQKNDLNRKF